MYSYAQVNRNDKEAGGQLFSQNPHNSLILISEVTGPYDVDIRSRTHFKPSLSKINQDREIFFNKDFHAVGLWHTHPEFNPRPSDEDKITTLKYLNAFNGAMNGFIQVIVGNTKDPDNFCVWLASVDKRNRWSQLKEL